MKTKVTITELNHEDLVNLFSTATYGSNWLAIRKKKKDYYGTPLEDDNDCAEDTWAKVLLAGKNVIVRDYYAEDEDEHYGNLPHKWNEEDGCMKYVVYLDDIKKGIEKCLESEDAWLIECAHHLMNDTADFDITEAEAIMQVILFGEQIYG